MANLNVRIKNKYDSYENWMNSKLVLEAGEIAIASIPSGDNTGLTPPAIGIKVGDGEKTFSQLSWIQATAGDVYSWAKAATKPEYKASEITGLADYISGEIQDTNTEYSFTLADNYKIKVQKKEVNGEYADYQSIDLTSAFAAKADKVANATAGNFAGLDASGNLTDSGKKASDFATAAQGALADSALQKADITSGSANGTIAVEGTDVAVTGLGSAAFTDAGAYAPAGHNHDSVYAAKAATESHIANGDIHVTTDDKAKWNTASEKALANEEAIKGLQPAGDYATKTEAQGYANAKDAAIQAAQAAADKAQGDVNTLSGKVGTVPADKTVVQMISDAQTAATYDDTALKARVKAVEDDYLKAADKTELSNAIDAVEAEIGEKPEEFSDATLWSSLGLFSNAVNGLTENDKLLLKDIEAIEADYLKAADKTELSTAINTEKARAEAAEAGLQTQINTIMNNPDAEGAINSINEFTQYVTEHGTIAEGFRTDIDKNKDDIAAMDTAYKAADTAIKGRLDVLEAINHDAYIAADTALKNELNGEIAKKADASALTSAVEALEGADEALGGRIDAVEAEIGEKPDVVDADVTMWEVIASAAGSIEQAFGVIGQVNGKVEAIEKDYLKAADKTELNGKITAAQGAADKAQGDVDAVAGRVTTLEGEMDAAQGAIEANAKAVSDLDSSLATIAKTGNVADLVQTAGTVLIFDCGTSAV